MSGGSTANERRRHLLRLLVSLPPAIMLGAVSRPSAARGEWSEAMWQVRFAAAADAAALAEVFNAHVAAGICPYSDMVEPWTSEDARRYLAVLNGSLLVEKDAEIVGFVGLIDYANPTTRSQLAEGTDPEVGVFALHRGRLASGELRVAAQHLAAGAARQLHEMGFAACTMRLPAQRVFDSDEWFSRHMEVRQVRKRDGVDHAREVRFDVSTGLAVLQAAGF